MTYLLIFVPIPIIAHFLGWSPLIVFFSACLGIVPLAGFMGKATEHLADRMGEGPGALLNATFGNACELIIGLSALHAGLQEVVKASIIGSIIGNILLVLGGSILAGGLKFERQVFNRTAATTSSTLLALSAISLVVPAVFHFTLPVGRHISEHRLALAISVILLMTYILSLWFSLKTHRHLYVREVDSEAEEAIGVTGWSVRKSTMILFLTTVSVVVLSEFLVHAVEATAHALGITQLFIGVILVAIIGNAAEHSTAILMAMKNKMDLSINIALGSGSQIAMLIAPILVFASYIMKQPMNLFFSPVEVLAVVVAVIILAFVTLDGECNWLEGVQLLAVYAILGAAFYFA